MGVRRILVVLVVEAALKSRPRSFDSRLHLLSNNLHRVIRMIQIGCSDESSLLLDKLIEVFILVLGLLASESLHPQIKRVHSPRHGVDESRLVMVNKAIHFVGVLLNLLSLFHLARVRAFKLWRANISFPLVFCPRIHHPVVNPLLVHKPLHFHPLFLPLVEGLGVISVFLVFLLSVLLRRFVTHLQVFTRLCNSQT